MKTMTDRAKAFLSQFENPSQCQNPRSFGFDGTNPYYNLLYSIAKDLQPNLVVELGTCILLRFSGQRRTSELIRTMADRQEGVRLTLLPEPRARSSL